MSLFLIPPGYALGWILDLSSFRKKPPLWRLVMSVPFSIALTPVLVYLLGRVSLGWPVWTFYGLLALAFILFFRATAIPKAAWVAAACVFAVVIFSLADLQFGHRLYYSVVAYDYSFRASITSAFVRAVQLPASNPFFFTGSPQPFRYHYFWFLIAALPVRFAEAVLGHTAFAARYGVVASAAFAGLGLMCLAAVYMRFFLARNARAVWMAVALFGVSGLDILPVFPQQFPSGGEWSIYATADWWNTDQVAGWLDTVLWVPHAAAALIACLAGFFILWDEPRVRWQAALGAGLAFASAAGLSVYVTALFAVICALWAFYLALRREWFPLCTLALAGACALLLAAPFLAELRGSPAAQGAFAAFALRRFDPWLQALEFWRITSPLAANLGNLIFLPLNYFLELGVFLAAGAAWFHARRRRWRTMPRHETALALMVLTPLVLCAVVRSTTIDMNDLGLRGMLPAQFGLLLLTADWFASGGLRKRLSRALLALGILTSVYQLALLRTFTILSDTGVVTRSNAIAADPGSGLRGYSTRLAYEFLDRTLPTTAVLQHNPDGHHDILAGLYADRQFALRDLPTAITFTGDRAGPTAAFEPIADLFAGNRSDPAAVCRALSIDALVLKDNDGAWAEREIWMRDNPVLFRSEHAIAIACRSVR